MAGGPGFDPPVKPAFFAAINTLLVSNVLISSESFGDLRHKETVAGYGGLIGVENYKIILGRAAGKNHR